jgi:hypothetical protein
MNFQEGCESSSIRFCKGPASCLCAIDLLLCKKVEELNQWVLLFVNGTVYSSSSSSLGVGLGGRAMLFEGLGAAGGVGRTETVNERWVRE